MVFHIKEVLEIGAPIIGQVLVLPLLARFHIFSRHYNGVISYLKDLLCGEQCVSINAKLHRIIDYLELAVYCLPGVNLLLHECIIGLHVGGSDLAVALYQVFH